MDGLEFNIIFAKNLKYWLQQRNITQLELSEYLNVSAASVSNWCCGKKIPRMDKIDSICNCLEIKRLDLFSNQELDGVFIKVCNQLDNEDKEILYKTAMEMLVSEKYNEVKNEREKDLVSSYCIRNGKQSIDEILAEIEKLSDENKYSKEIIKNCVVRTAEGMLELWKENLQKLEKDISVSKQ